ncbi:unnamed protein product, partial [Brassica napus]
LGWNSVIPLSISTIPKRKPGRAGEVKVHVGYVAQISSLSDSIHTEDFNRVGAPFLEIES